MTTTYRYLGYGVTNNNGVAKLDHDANGDPIDHSYTGTGAGEIDIVASLDDNEYISESSIQSETYELIDATILDTGTSSSHNDIWYNQANAKADVYAEYTEIRENGGNAVYRLKGTNSINKTNIAVEFDLWCDGATTNNCISFLNTSGSGFSGTFALNQLNLQSETWNHIKLEIDSNGVVTPNNISSASKTLSISTEKMLFAFLTNGDITIIRFKNFMCYPI